MSTEKRTLSFTNSISWDPDDDLDRRAPLRLALDAFKCAISMLDAATTSDLYWFKEQLDKIADPHLPPGASSWGGSATSSWSGSR